MKARKFKVTALVMQEVVLIVEATDFGDAEDKAIDHYERQLTDLHAILSVTKIKDDI